MFDSEKTRARLKIASAARYLPITMSRSRAGSVSRSSSVPCCRSWAHVLMVTAGMNTSMIHGRYLLS